MPLNLTFKRSSGGDSGFTFDAQALLREALPEIKFHKEPSGIEKIRLGEAAGATFPEVIRKHLVNDPGLQLGVYEKDGLWAEFLLGSGEELETLDVEIRGSGSIDQLVNALNAYGLTQVE